MTAKKYRKKPVVIEAIQWTGYNAKDVADFMKLNKCKVFGIGHTITIETLEGTMLANTGDYIIKGVKGEFYPCKPDIFEQTYEEIQNDR